MSLAIRPPRPPGCGRSPPRGCRWKARPTPGSSHSAPRDRRSSTSPSSSASRRPSRRRWCASIPNASPATCWAACAATAARSLRGAIARMGEEGAGMLLYLAQEGRNIGLVNKLRAYTLQDRGLDTLDANRALGWGADERNFLIAATMLDVLGRAPRPAADQQSGQDRRPDRLRRGCGRPRGARVRAERGERPLPGDQGGALRPPAGLRRMQALVHPDGRLVLRGQVFRAALGRGGVRFGQAGGRRCDAGRRRCRCGGCCTGRIGYGRRSVPWRWSRSRRMTAGATIRRSRLQPDDPPAA